MELTVTGRGHLPGWLLFEARQGGKLLLKICAPACLANTLAQSLDKNYTAKSLISLLDSDLEWLLSRQGRKE